MIYNKDVNAMQVRARLIELTEGESAWCSGGMSCTVVRGLNYGGAVLSSLGILDAQFITMCGCMIVRCTGAPCEAYSTWKKIAIMAMKVAEIAGYLAPVPGGVLSLVATTLAVNCTDSGKL